MKNFLLITQNMTKNLLLFLLFINITLFIKNIESKKNIYVRITDKIGKDNKFNYLKTNRRKAKLRAVNNVYMTLDFYILSEKQFNMLNNTTETIKEYIYKNYIKKCCKYRSKYSKTEYYYILNFSNILKDYNDKYYYLVIENYENNELEIQYGIFDYVKFLIIASITIIVSIPGFYVIVWFTCFFPCMVCYNDYHGRHWLFGCLEDDFI